LAGDAAGLASEFNGEGIYQALISGEEIAKTILNSNHKPVKIEKILNVKKRHAQVLKIIENSSFVRPLLLELIGRGFHSKYLTNKAFQYVLN
jgi:geranylgeranyl reductase